MSAHAFLSWAGSKKWLIPSINNIIPQQFNNYYEPFLGSGSVFFGLKQSNLSFLSDTIPELIGCYSGIKDNVEGVIELLAQWPVEKDTYYHIRSNVSDDPTYKSARFIYLNKLCFNGLYRVNKKGVFNVPFGKPKTNKTANFDNLRDAAKHLNNASLAVIDFEQALMNCCKGDLVFLDPPYVNSIGDNGFADYNSRVFSWEDQKRLKTEFERLDEIGAYVLLTNTDHHSIVDLYYRYNRIERTRYSSMSGKISGRGNCSELIILGSNLERVIRACCNG